MRLLVALLALAALSTGALAADLGPYPRNGSIKDVPAYAPPITWTGFYVGVQGGGAWGTSRHTDAGGTTTGDFDIDGGFIGGTVGYNLQSGNLVWGIEADVAASDISGRSVVLCGAGCSTNIDWFGTVRGRLGLDFNGFMPFITAGFAFGGVEASSNGLATASDTKTGWTIGGGGEWRFDQHWSVKAEYLFIDLDSISVPTPVPTTAKVDEIHAVRAGINFRF